MTHEQTIADCILEAVSRSPGCLLENLLEELTRDCPGLTWNQIFVVIARMSEEERLVLQGRGPGSYALKLPANV